MKKNRIYIICLVAFIMIGFWLWFASAGWTVSVGNRAGTVTKLSQKGVMFKTWEGELSIGSLSGQGVREKWEFSVEEDQLEMEQVNGKLVAIENARRVIDVLNESLDSQENVKLLYRQQMGTQTWKGYTSYFIVGVKKIKKE